MIPVSYTHLDVYKRQLYGIAAFCFYGREYAGIRTYPWFLAAGERLEYSQSAGANLSLIHIFDLYWHEVERLIRCEGFTAYQVLTNSECVSVLCQE